MEFDTIIKLGLLVVAVGGIPKLLWELRGLKKSQLRDEYTFAKEFFLDISNGKLHPYCIEKGYSAISGNKDLSVYEVEFLLTLNKPVECLNTYSKCKKYMCEVVSNTRMLQMQKPFRNVYRMYGTVIICFLGYFVSSMTAMIPIIFYPNMHLNEIILFSITLTPILAYCAYCWLMRGAKIKKAFQLVKSQSQHTKKILIDH